MHSLSSFTDDVGLRRERSGSALPKFPSSVSDGGWFRGYTGSLLRYGLSSCSPPCTDLTRNFPQPTGTFTPELPASRSPFSSSGITTVATERFHRWDFHPLESQLASLHRLFHPLVGSRTGARLRRFSLAVAPRFLWECLNSGGPAEWSGQSGKELVLAESFLHSDMERQAAGSRPL